MNWRDKLLNTEYFECDCGDFDHTLRVSYFKDEPTEMYVEIHLRQQPFFKRLWKAIKYVCGFRSRYGDFDEFMWSYETADKYRDFIGNFLAAHEDYLDKIDSEKK